MAISALLPDLAKAAEPFRPLSGPRSRVLFVNDLSGDVDGLFALAHQILSPSAELRGIIGTTPRERDSSAKRSAELAEEMLALMDMPGSIPIYTGAEQQMQDMVTPVASDGSDAIIAEAMRTDSELPLYIAVGGGLTEVASAVLQEPKIADRFTLVWIGGDALPDGGTGETNFNIDPLAAQFLFNESTVRIWQVPRSAYAQCLVSATELQTNVGRYGKIGPWLQDRLFDVTRKYGMRFNTGETWNLGDNPLVLLTALTDWVPSNRQPPLRFERTGSSLFDEVTAPAFNPDGTFTLRDEGRTIRVYRNIDTRMLFADFFAKMQVNFERA
ncbi:MAG: nucleoside hydrolase [Sphingomonadaceae bacterium]